MVLRNQSAQLLRLILSPSMSRRGNCYDNASMESFSETLETELMQHRLQ